MLDVMSGPHWGDIYSFPAPAAPFAESLLGGVRGLKVAWSPDLGFAEADPQVLRICESAAKAFVDLGAHVEEAHPNFEDAAPHHSALYVVDHLEALSAFGPPEQIAPDLDPLTATMLYVGREMKATEYARAMFAKQDLATQAGRFFQTYDLLLTPTLALPPPPLEVPNPADFLNWLPFITVHNMTGQPAASIPAGWTDDGMPVGLQIAGPAHGEAVVLRAAAAFEEARPWAHIKPPIA
jgi:aspartyl-tRNA(Asn)/glutamyl-tRNA(Gln) amidotransferase subunit A